VTGPAKFVDEATDASKCLAYREKRLAPFSERIGGRRQRSISDAGGFVLELIAEG